MAERRERARRLQEEKKAEALELTAEKVAQMKLEAEEKKQAAEEEARKLERETSFIAFARVFSGTLKPGMSIYVLGPKYDPAKALQLRQEGKTVCDEAATIFSTSNDLHIMKASVTELYLLLGRDMEELAEVPAGNVIGIGGLEKHVLKSATLSSDIACPAFVEVTQSAVPILRVAVETVVSSDLPKLEQGLHLLNQADANVQISLTDMGEHILVTAGEVHLERCLKDLKETFAGVEVIASSPIVPFRY